MSCVVSTAAHKAAWMPRTMSRSARWGAPWSGSQGTWTNHAPRRKRKLLLHHYEINELMLRTREKGHTIVPMRLYFLGGRAKLEIALARGKKLYDKRQTLRERQDNREAERAMSSKGKIDR